jgi:hypothetical protein
MMRKQIAVLIGVVVFAAASAASNAQTIRTGPIPGPTPGTAPRPPSPNATPSPSATARPAATPAPVVLTGEYLEMATEANMTATQQKALGSISRNEANALAKFDQDNAKHLDELNKRLADAQKRLDDLNKLTTDANTARQACQKQLDLIHKQIDLVSDNRARLSHTFKVQAMNLFTPDQKPVWVSYVLNKLMTAEFMPVGLSSDQQTRVKDFCNQAGLSATSADVSANKDLQDSVKQQVIGILDDQQKLKYNQIVQEREAKAAATTATTP